MLKRDDEAKDKAPRVLQNDIDPSVPKGARSFSTSVRRRVQTQAIMNPQSAELQGPGHIFDLPELPLPRTSHLKHRYESIVEQVTNLLMRDGKKSVAQRVRPSVLFPYSTIICSNYKTV